MCSEPLLLLIYTGIVVCKYVFCMKYGGTLMSELEDAKTQGIKYKSASFNVLRV